MSKIWFRKHFVEMNRNNMEQQWLRRVMEAATTTTPNYIDMRMAYTQTIDRYTKHGTQVWCV
jgi:hypothetical protein